MAVVWSSEVQSSKGSEFKRLGASRAASSKPTAEARRQRMAVAVVQRLGVQRLGVQRLGVQKARQAEKVLTSSKTGKVPVCVFGGCRRRPVRPLRSLHRGAERAGTGTEARPERVGRRKISARYKAL